MGWSRCRRGTRGARLSALETEAGLQVDTQSRGALRRETLPPPSSRGGNRKGRRRQRESGYPSSNGTLLVSLACMCMHTRGGGVLRVQIQHAC